VGSSEGPPLDSEGVGPTGSVETRSGSTRSGCSRSGSSLSGCDLLGSAGFAGSPGPDFIGGSVAPLTGAVSCRTA
jgi:hypothetical protein